MYAEVRGHGTTGNPVNDYTYGEHHLISSKRVIEIFRDGLKESYPNSEIKKTGQSVHVWLDSYGMGIDVVPCFHIIPRDGSRDFYYIPKGGDSHEWMTTNPKIDAEIVDGLDKRHGNKFKPIVKIIKYWNQVHNGSRLQSYHLETIISHMFHAHPGEIQDYPTAVRYFFNNVDGYFANACADMTGLGDPVDTYLTDEDRRLTRVKASQAKQAIASQGLIGLPLPTTQRLSGWRQIFGNNFGL